MDGKILIVLPLEVLPQAAVPRRATQGAEGGNELIASFLADHDPPCGVCACFSTVHAPSDHSGPVPRERAMPWARVRPGSSRVLVAKLATDCEILIAPRR